MNFHRIRSALTAAVEQRINAPTETPAQGSAEMKSYFSACGAKIRPLDWRATLQTFQDSKSITDLQTAIANTPAQQRDEMLTHSNENLHQSNAINLFPMGYLLDRSIRLIFLERGTHTKQFVHILAALNPASKETAVSYCVSQTYRAHDFPTTTRAGNPTHYDHMRYLLTQAENAFGDAYPAAFCMIQKVFQQNPSLPNPAYKQPKPAQIVPQPPIPPVA